MFNFRRLNFSSATVSSILLTSVILICSSTAPLFGQRIFLVDAEKPVDSVAKAINVVRPADWANATGDLQSAIDSATTSDEIWVKKGTYRPSRDIAGQQVGSNSSKATFYIKSGMKLYGGFSGIETELAARNAVINVTTLQGAYPGGKFADHVVYLDRCPNTMVLNGFTVSGGRGDRGAGIFADAAASVIENCFFIDNKANESGGGIYISSGSPVIVNSVFTQNAASSGAAIFIDSSSSSVLNCTIVANASTDAGGGIFARNASRISISNSAIWGNTGNNRIDNLQTNVSTSSLNVRYSLVGLPSGKYSGTGNLNQNPLFADAENLGLRYLPGSPLKDAGSNLLYSASLPTNDIGGSTRITSGTIDIGAFENPGFPQINATRVIYVDSSKETLTGNGLSWSKAFKSLADAFNVINGSPGTYLEVWVAKGTYVPTTNLNGKVAPEDVSNATFLMKDGLKLYGGFNGTETQLTQRSPGQHLTSLSGLVKTNGNEQHVLNIITMNQAGSVQTVDGFTITEGYANYTHSGGGIHVDHSSLVLKNCRIIKNGNGAVNIFYSTADIQNCYFSDNDNQNGGAIVNIYGKGSYRNCVFEKNISTKTYSEGAGIYNLYSSPSIYNCDFLYNETSNGGSAISNSSESSPLVFNCRFIGNAAAQQVSSGGAVKIYINTNPVFVNCLFTKNSASGGGAITSMGMEKTALINCTITNNYAYTVGGGIIIPTSPAYKPLLTISNSIVWGNKTGSTDPRALNLINTYERESTVGFKVNNSIIGDHYQKGQPSVTFPGSAVMNVDPRFVDTAQLLLQLQSNSPAIDAGDNASYPANLATSVDLSGQPRVSGSKVDIGAFEMSNIILPLVLSEFSGRENASDNELRWTTSEQGGITHFVIEKSWDGISYFPIGVKQAIAVNSQMKAQYRFTDTGVTKTAYYRLQSIETTGALAYSQIVSISRKSAAAFKISLTANPVSATAGYLIGGNAASRFEVSVSDLTGKLIYIRSNLVANNSYTFNAASLQPGVYIVKCMDTESRKVEIVRLVKQ
jgi:hypothetical protein